MDATYPKASEVVRLRLADSVSLRRQNFLYLREREAKARGEADPEMDNETEQRPVFTLQNQDAKDQAPTMPTSLMQGSTTKRQPSLSIFSASTANPHKALKPASARSFSIFAVRSHLGISKMIPLPPPKTSTGYIKCPYCFLVCREEEMRNEHWEYVLSLLVKLRSLVARLALIIKTGDTFSGTSCLTYAFWTIAALQMYYLTLPNAGRII